MTSTLEQASAILKAAEEASDKPWRNMPTPNRHSIIAESGTIAVLSFPDDCKHVENARLIALARNTAPAIALALIEKHRALEECLELLNAMVDYCPPARDEWMSNNAYLEYADFYNRVQDFLARQGDTA